MKWGDKQAKEGSQERLVCASSVGHSATALLEQCMASTSATIAIITLIVAALPIIFFVWGALSASNNDDDRGSVAPGVSKRGTWIGCFHGCAAPFHLSKKVNC